MADKAGQSSAAQAWRDEFERCRHEAKRYAERAKAAQAEAKHCRDRRDFIGALLADCRAREYRARRDHYKEAAAGARRRYASPRAA